MNFKSIIMEEFEILRKKELQEGKPFKAIAYGKILSQLKSIDTIERMEDLKDVKGIGESLRQKLQEIFETGMLKQAEEAKKDTSIEEIDHFMKIYGVGRVKAVKLVKEENLHTIEELRKAVQKKSKLLNKNQTVGLMYYEDLLERIPRAEMKKHEKLLQKVIPFHIEVVGSYRRGEPNSGDIDVLIQWPTQTTASEMSKAFHQVVLHLKESKYIVEVLAEGDKKCMAICQLPGQKARRLDLLITPEEEYGYTILYFTGSDKFNVALRKIALEKGYSLNEHGFTPSVPSLLTEAAILDFLGYHYIEPSQRKSAVSLQKFLKLK